MATMRGDLTDEQRRYNKAVLTVIAAGVTGASVPLAMIGLLVAMAKLWPGSVASLWNNELSLLTIRGAIMVLAVCSPAALFVFYRIVGPAFRVKAMTDAEDGNNA